MAARQIIVPGAMPSRDANGRSLPAKFRFYEPNTTIPATVWTDATLSVALAFPLLSDSAGRWPQIWADEADTFDVGWSDQVYDATIAAFTGVRPADDAVLASVALAEAAETAAEVAQAAAEAAAALAQAAAAMVTGAPFKATSATSNTIGTGTKVFVLDQEGEDLFAEGQTVVAAVKGNSANQMVSRVNAFDGVNLTLVTISHAEPSGVGPYTSWEISLGASGGVQSVAGLTGIVSSGALKAALALLSTDITDFNTAVDDRAAALAIALRR